MAALLAEIQAEPRVHDERASVRRTLKLEVHTEAPGDSKAACVHNLSQHGLLLETSADLRLGDLIDAELPHAGLTQAIVVWARDSFFGCEFVSPVSKAAVSAALLLSPAREVPAPEVEWEGPRLDAMALELRDGSAESQFVLYLSLVLGFAAAALFVVALLSAPFSAN